MTMTEAEALELLELSGTPNADAVDEAFRRLAHEKHTDHGGASDRPMMRLNEAREVARTAADHRLPVPAQALALSAPLRGPRAAASLPKPAEVARLRSSARVGGAAGGILAAVGILGGPAAAQFLPALPEAARAVVSAALSMIGLALLVLAAYQAVAAGRWESAWTEADSLLAARDICSDAIVVVWRNARERAKYAVYSLDQWSEPPNVWDERRGLTRSEIEGVVTGTSEWPYLRRSPLALFRGIIRRRHVRDSSLRRLWGAARVIGPVYFGDLLLFHGTESKLLIAFEEIGSSVRIRFSPPSFGQVTQDPGDGSS
jgi:hypothetical protein